MVVWGAIVEGREEKRMFGREVREGDPRDKIDQCKMGKAVMSLS